MMQMPERGSKARWAALLCGITIFLWLGPEDNHVWPVVLLSTLASVLMVSLWVMQRYGGRTLTGTEVARLSIIGGALTGLITSPVTALLMLLKNARHAHFTPDFLPQQMLAMLERAPLWAVAGGFAGAGLALLLIGLLTVFQNPSNCTAQTSKNGSMP